MPASGPYPHCPKCGEAKRVRPALSTDNGFYAYYRACGDAWHHDTLKHAGTQPPQRNAASDARKPIRP